MTAAVRPLSGPSPVLCLQMRTGHRTHLQHPAVDDPRCTGDIGSGGRTQERNDRGNLARVAGPAQRYAGTVLPAYVDVLLVGHGRRDLAWGDRIHCDSVLGELQRGGASQQPQPTLGGAVGRRPHAWLMLVHAGDIDDAAPSTSVHHPPSCPLQTQERAIQVRCEDLMPGVVVQIEQRRQEALVAEQEAERVRNEAQGQADATFIRAQGEAQALAETGRAVRENPEILELERIRALESANVIYVPSSGILPVLDLGAAEAQTPAPEPELTPTPEA